VALLGAGLVALVLAAAAVTALLPTDVQAVVFHTPLLIAVLIVGTALVLWRILRAPGPGGLQ
jgi:FtsH-binding integral membrane protein